MNETIFNISTGPHFRRKLTTGIVMLNVIAALMPAALFGIWRYGLHAFLVIILCILTAVITEFLFDLIAKKRNTVTDLSAVVTGLLLALSLSPSVPLYIPVVGAVFAILVVKCFFGGLGKNFMNPALAARCFLLISFGTQMTGFTVDGVSQATPLAALRSGEAINISRMYLGLTPSVIGGSGLMLLIGGLYLWVSGTITLHIPAAVILSFTAFMAIFGGSGFDITFLLAHIIGGGVLMGAFFMATDPVTNPVTVRAQVCFGIIIGLLAGLFRVKGASADSVSYAIVITNMFVPFLDKMPVHKPLGYTNRADGEYAPRKFPKAAINLTVIALVTGLALGGVFSMTKAKIEEQKLKANAESYRAVLPEAADFSVDDAVTAAIAELDGNAYDSSYGRTYVNEAVIGTAENGETAGYVISVTSADGFEGNITLSVGLTADGTVTGISFTELGETPGMGMRVDEDVFKDQFRDVSTDAFILNKSGSGTADNEIDTVSGASTSSGAVVNAVNTALAFYRDHIA